MKNTALNAIATLAISIICVFVVSISFPKYADCRISQSPGINTTEIHNLQATSNDYWIIYLWTNGKSYRPGEPIALSLRFFTESTAEFEQPAVTATLKTQDGKTVHTEKLTVTAIRDKESTYPLFRWDTSNLFPDSDSPRISRVVDKGKYSLRIECKYKDGRTPVLNNINIDIGR